MNTLSTELPPTMEAYPVTTFHPGLHPTPSVVTNETQSSVLDVSPDTCGFDNDISDLLRDNFGIIPRNDVYAEYGSKVEEKFIEDLEHNLPLLAEIFDDLQNVVKSENNNKTVKKEPKIPGEAERTKIDPAKTITDIQKEIEYEIELNRVERLRKPKFQTMPAYEKRAKQEAQWRAAIRAARRASSLHSTAPYQHPVKYSGGSSNLHTVVLPILTKDSLLTSTSLDISSLDLTVSNSSSSKPISNMMPNPTVRQPGDIVKSNLMATTKKHLSAANHFPANSRLFNRSLKQLQSQADAISSAYLSAATRNPLHSKVHVHQASSNALNKTTNITRFLKDVNSNPVDSNMLCTADPVLNNASSFPTSHNGKVVIKEKEKYPCPSVPDNNNNVVQTKVVKTNHLPVYSLPTNQVRTPQVLYHISCAATTTTRSTVPWYLLVGAQSPTTALIKKITPLVYPQSSVPLPPPPSSRARPVKKTPPIIPSNPSCYNCQKLASALPYLAHSRRKLVMSSRRVPEAAMVLVCEICGAVVRETVIFGDYIILDHVSTAHFPSFLINSQDQGLGQEDSQNVIRLGEEESDEGVSFFLRTDCN